MRMIVNRRTLRHTIEYRMSDRLKQFSSDELHAVVFCLNVAETVDPLDEVAAELRDEMIRELKERDLAAK